VGTIWTFDFELVKRQTYMLTADFLVKSGFLELIDVELMAIIP
jgi:hypothetical protein